MTTSNPKKASKTAMSNQQNSAEHHVLEQNPLMDAYVLLGWDILRDGDPKKGTRYPCVHTSWTTFNKRFREIFDGADPVEYTKMLQGKGLVDIVLMKGGALLKPCDAFLAPAPKEHKALLKRVRALLESDHEARTQKLAQTAARKQAAPAETKPTKAWNADATSAALKRLGY